MHQCRKDQWFKKKKQKKTKKHTIGLWISNVIFRKNIIMRKNAEHMFV